MSKTENSANFDLFERHREDLLSRTAPLADRMRPRTLDEYIGQDHIIGEGRLLRRAIQIDQLSSVIFYGPPGTGKTTLARIIANTTKAQFLSINAVLAGIKDIRDSIETAQKTLSLYGKRTILFIDEVHRFNKSQQDALLPHVENGVIILIGATTENPYFEVNKALVSRSRVFQLNILNEDDLKKVITQALTDKERGYGTKSVVMDEDAVEHLVKVANGDARAVLNALELAVETTSVNEHGVLRITRQIAEESIQQRAVLYDKDGDAHYDTISAFIKSVRGSDPDAALYWMSKMIYAGEDPRFIFRRLLILACEDIGLADPYALGVVVSAAQAFDYVGLPEGRYHLAHACLYLATAHKSNSSMAFFDALSVVTQQNSDDVPNHLRDASRDKEGLGHGAGYLYPHAYRDHWVAQQYLPGTLQGKMFYQPSDQGYEKQIGERVTRLREEQLEAMIEDDDTSPLFISAGEQGMAKQQWHERTLGSRGKQLGSVRERIMTLANIGRSDLVLDLNARTGLLAFEAARRTPEGGVWALAHDSKSFATLKSLAEPFDPLQRPQILQTSFKTFIEDIKSVAGQSVVFDIIIGRSVLRDTDDKTVLFERILSLLGKKGKVVLSEPVSSEGQRLTSLLVMSKIPDEIGALLLRTEQELYNDPDNPVVNWTSDSLKNQLSSVPGIRLDAEPVIDTQLRRFKGSDIEYWFRESSEPERKSLGQRLLDNCSLKELERLKLEIHKQLDNREVSWKTVTFFITAKKME